MTPRTLQAVYQDVSWAILRAERFGNDSYPPARAAWAFVSALEEEAADLLSADCPEGEVARAGAITAAAAAGDEVRAQALRVKWGRTERPRVERD